jgi:hypothetical protein
LLELLENEPSLLFAHSVLQNGYEQARGLQRLTEIVARGVEKFRLCLRSEFGLFPGLVKAGLALLQPLLKLFFLD